MNVQDFRLPLGDKELVIQTGKLAQQTNGSVVASIGDNVVLATACFSREARAGVNFLPLMVNYQEKYYAGGRIKSSRFMKREARPNDEAILTSRVIDRTLRPMFQKGLHNDIQVMITILSWDGENPIDMLASVAASAVLTISDIPFNGPTATVRVGMNSGEFVLNPSDEAMKKSDLDLIVSANSENVIMIEAGGNEVEESTMLEALAFGEKWSKKICTFLTEVRTKVGKEKLEITIPVADPKIKEYLTEKYTERIQEVVMNADISKLERFSTLGKMRKEAIGELETAFPENENGEREVDLSLAGDVFGSLEKGIIRNNILEKGQRIKGRKFDEIRTLTSEVGILPRTHGTGLFQRGETQGLTVCTLGSPSSEQLLENYQGESTKRYFHHYNFPPFSVGETSNRLFTGNREIGHGALAERALIPVLPDVADFPYTIRLVTEILASNGSSSMAATCGSTLALMDAGVPIKAPVAGIAMGLMTDSETGKFVVLTDLQDEEDFGGDMDFKVTGTAKGITAIQMDVKLPGISPEVFTQAFEQARVGRMQVLESMNAAIAEPRSDLSAYAPRLMSFKINPEKIRLIIGKGGETIQKITAETGVEIDIDDDGTIVICSTDGASSKKAREWIDSIVEEPEVGKIYTGQIVRIESFGAFFQVSASIEGIIHVSLLTDKYVDDVSKIVSIGQEVQAKLVNIDDRGRLRFSMKDVPSA